MMTIQVESCLFPIVAWRSQKDENKNKNKKREKQEKKKKTKNSSIANGRSPELLASFFGSCPFPKKG